MVIQNLSVVVPNKTCINHCESCPSRMHDDRYPLFMDEALPDFDLYLNDYIKRLAYARDNGCNTVMLTGTSEPQQNRKFLLWFGMMMKMMKNPFYNIEMQCTGALLDTDYIQFLRRHVGVNLIALSVFALNKSMNMSIINPPKGIDIDPEYVASDIISEGCALRMCLNMTKYFDDFAERPEVLFNLMKSVYRANQVTLRVLYAPEGDMRPESIWVRENSAKPGTVRSLKDYVKYHGNLLGRLPYGALKYGVDGMSVVIDDDSMGKAEPATDTYKYLILRPDCRLYSSWDDPASLIF